MHESLDALRARLDLATIPELEARRVELVADQQAIQAQLGTDGEGKHQTDEEYWTWRSRAVTKLRYVNRELTALNQALKNARRLEDSTAPLGRVHLRRSLVEVCRDALKDHRPDLARELDFVLAQTVAKARERAGAGEAEPANG